MPRKARCYSGAPYYHVMVQGIKKEVIFLNDTYKSTYLRILKKYIAENNITLIAYCIMGNHAHMLLKPQKTADLSKCMHQTNSTYASYYNKELNRVGYVFRNRFKAEEIYDYYYLHNCIKYIHMNPVKAKMCPNQADYVFSSYNNYLEKSGFVTSELLKEIFPIESEYFKILDNTIPIYEFVEDSLSFDEGKVWFDEYLEEKNFNLELLKNNHGLMCQAIKDIKKECNMKNNDISAIVGLDKSRITRILNEK